MTTCDSLIMNIMSEPYAGKPHVRFDEEGGNPTLTLRYVDGMGLYNGYFAPRGMDPMGLEEWRFGISGGLRFLFGGSKKLRVSMVLNLFGGVCDNSDNGLDVGVETYTSFYYNGLGTSSNQKFSFDIGLSGYGSYGANLGDGFNNPITGNYSSMFNGGYSLGASTNQTFNYNFATNSFNWMGSYSGTIEGFSAGVFNDTWSLIDFSHAIVSRSWNLDTVSDSAWTHGAFLSYEGVTLSETTFTGLQDINMPLTVNGEWQQQLNQEALNSTTWSLDFSLENVNFSAGFYTPHIGQNAVHNAIGSPTFTNANSPWK